jgi:transketolase
MGTDSRPTGTAALAQRARRTVLQLAAHQPVHLGSSLSVIDILATLVRDIALSPATVGDPDRDRLILSKGHAVWALYAVLGEVGVLDIGDGERLAGHPCEGTPGVDAATGALGHGLSIGAGYAAAARLHGSRRRTFVVLGDGELNEGSVWEAAMFAAHSRLSSLTAVVDVNGLQQEGRTGEVLDLMPLDEKWRAFGWRVMTVDGHDTTALHARLCTAADPTGRPSVILAATVKGKGVPFMEHSLDWHVGSLSPDQLSAALAAVDGAVHR